MAMGRVKHQTPAAAAAAATPSSALKHFTHPHDLHPLSLKPQPLCSGCKLPSSGTMYTCTPCNFTLHQSCANLPRLITHPSHRGCTLSPLTASPYPGGRFSCNACSLTADTWNYHCHRCDYDLHVTCASKPLKIRHHSHTSCELHLTFENPYMDSKGFSCDIRRKIGSKQWLYRCNSCDFDVHLDCTAAVPQPMLQHQRSAPAHHHHRNQFSAPPQLNGFVRPPQPYLMHSASAGAIGNLYQPYGSVAGNPAAVVNNGGLGGNIMTAALQGFVGGAFQGVGQAVVQELIGGDGGGEDVCSY